MKNLKPFTAPPCITSNGTYAAETNNQRLRNIMKHFTSFVAALALLSAGLTAGHAAETFPPGQVDFGKFAPPGAGGEFVEVNLSSLDFHGTGFS